MSLTEDEKNTCKEIAREIVKEVLREHIKSCPHGQNMHSSKMFLVGVCVGSGFAGGGFALAAARLILGS